MTGHVDADHALTPDGMNYKLPTYLLITDVEPRHDPQSNTYLYIFTLRFSNIDYVTFTFSHRFRTLYSFYLSINETADAKNLPAFPSKTWGKARTPEKIYDRTKRLKRYFNLIVKHPRFCREMYRQLIMRPLSRDPSFSDLTNVVKLSDQMESPFETKVRRLFESAIEQMDSSGEIDSSYVRVMEQELHRLRVSSEQEESLLLVEITGGIDRSEEQSCVVQ